MSDSKIDPCPLSTAEEGCYLWIDKYKPRTFEEVSFNQVSGRALQACAKAPDLPHMIIKAPAGSGKNTFADLYVQAKFHKTNLHTRQQTLEIRCSNSKTIELSQKYSSYHYKLDPSAYGVYDRLIIGAYIKDLIQTPPIASSGIPYHLIIIEHADRLTLEAQQSLRRTLEKYVDNFRVIFLLSHESNLIEPLMSRCVQFRLSAPTTTEITAILTKIAQAEHVSCQPTQLVKIAEYAKRNVRTAINLLQSLATFQPEVLDSTDFFDGGSQFVEIDQFYQQILTHLWGKRTPKTILTIRVLLYDLLVHCVPPVTILKDLFHRIFLKLDATPEGDRSRHLLVKICVRIEHACRNGSKPIYSLEGFIVGVMSILDGATDI